MFHLRSSLNPLFLPLQDVLLAALSMLLRTEQDKRLQSSAQGLWVEGQPIQMCDCSLKSQQAASMLPERVKGTSNLRS